MSRKTNVLVIGICVVFMIVLFWSSTTIRGTERKYEVETEVTLPEYRTDAGRAIDAYERLMERHMALTEKHLLRFDGDCQVILKRLDSMDVRLDEISLRLAEIEKAMGITSKVNSAEPDVPAGEERKNKNNLKQ